MVLGRDVSALALVGLLGAVGCGGQTVASADAGASPTRQPASASSPEFSWDGGLLRSSGPGFVRCGSVTCSPGDHCCLVPEGDPATNGCDSRSLTACRGTQDVRDCDEAADCHSNEECCYSVFTSPPSTVGSLCVPTGTCTPFDVIGCANDADCAGTDAGRCVAQQCRGDILQTCGLLPSEECPP